ncbi:hypothetical protein ACI1MP_26015 [Kitasatospora griseola]|uniref:hypothetical protein n=1 Tax=Kitasatospora griseola TaxID=2064 RepID=UPI0038557128
MILPGLDEHRVRRWTSWQHWTAPAMLAHEFRVVTAAIERTTVTDRGRSPSLDATGL